MWCPLAQGSTAQANPVKSNKYGGSFRIVHQPHLGIGWGDCQHSKRTMEGKGQANFLSPSASVGISTMTRSPTFRFVSGVILSLCFLIFLCNLKVLLCQFPGLTQTSHSFGLVVIDIDCIWTSLIGQYSRSGNTRVSRTGRTETP